MKTKSLILGTLVLLALLVSACGPTTVNQAAPPPLRTLSVAGSGEAHLAPDIAYIYIGVHTEKLTAAEAVAENTTQTEALIAAIRDFGIEANDIRTMNFSIWPVDRYDPQTGQPTGEKTYAVDNTVYVTVRELDTLGDLLDTAVEAGANTVNSVQFDVEDKDEALQTARAEAIRDAQAKAQELAEASGVTLGELQTINFIDSPVYPIFDGKGGGAGVAAEAAAVPIQPGQLTFTVTVNVTYLID
ncbi:MAG TPA: SIMPL domain-containing protein [Anaerolineales bacterium]|nr:SIMPL domain-containing protein [Anaerolineales bacterium]